MKRYKIQMSKKEECSNGKWVKYEDIRAEFGAKCDCCGEYGQDRRNLLMGCGYDMSELGRSFKQTHDIEGLPGMNRSLFQLFVCKQCRGRWMIAIKEWFVKRGRENE